MSAALFLRAEDDQPDVVEGAAQGRCREAGLKVDLTSGDLQRIRD
jgi:hypothetical protein